jgi:SAM-dependent methyltransferase
MTYYLKESEWYQSVHVPEGMNLDMINQPNRLSELLLPAIDLVEPNKIFIDMGCGTGLLGLHALDKGAKFVSFVEIDTQMFHILENVLAKKLDPSKSKLINKDIEHLTIEDFNNGLPDIAISEFYGPRLFDEGYVNYTKQLRSLSPNCKFIPETYIGDFYIADIDYTQGIWPIDAQLIDHYKFMYKTKGFAKHIAFPKNAESIGKISFDANKQEFINSLNFTFNSNSDKLLYGRMAIQHDHLIQYFTSIGWFLDRSDINKTFKIYFDIDNNFNPRLIIC